MHTDKRKETNTALPIYTLHDFLCRKSQGIYKKITPKINTWVQQGDKIQDKHTQINSISIYYDTKIKNIILFLITKKWNS